MLLPWATFFALLIILLTLDLGVFHRRSRAYSLREATGWTVIWISLGIAFGGVVYLLYSFGMVGGPGGSSRGVAALVDYLTGYFVEESLSIDNMFVISLLFRRFAVKPEYQHRVLFWGIMGALVFRGTMIASGVWLVTRFKWIFYIFGAYLLIAGVKLFRPDSEEQEARSVLVWLRRRLPMAKQDHGSHFLAREDGRLVFTDLFLALLTIEFTDVVFALDSVPAVLAITTDPFLVATSNAFAVLGLRSLYFVLAGMLERFRYLKTGLAILLVYIGAKMLTASLVHIPNAISLAVVGTIITVSVVASQLRRSPDAP